MHCGLAAEVDLLVVNAAQLLTCAPARERPKVGEEMLQLGIIEGGAVAVVGERIAAVGPTEEVLRSVRCGPRTRVVNADGQVVTPGLVDPHTHLIFAGWREEEMELRLRGFTYLDILRAGGGILSTVRATRAASLEELVRVGLQRAWEMLTQGTTTAEAKSGYGLSLEHELKQLAAVREVNARHPLDLVPTFLGAHAIPEEYSGSPERYVDQVVEEMLPAVARDGLAEFCDVFCEPGVFDLKQSRRILTRARQLGLGLKVHADEIHPQGGAELAAELEAASADHLVAVSDEGIDRLAASGVVAVLLPGTSFVLGGRHAPARRMLERGVAVALATDFNPGTCPCNSLPLIMVMGCLCLGMRPAEVVNAVTINAAWAIGRAHDIGSIEPGKLADLVVFEAPNYKYLCYRLGTNLVRMVIKRGQVVVER